MSKIGKGLGKGIKCPMCGKTRTYIMLDPYNPIFCQHRERDFIEEVIRLKPFENRNKKVLDHIDGWEEGEIARIRKMLEGN